jgi:hypothetical protein
MRLIAALMLFMLFMLAWYIFVDYAPALAKSTVRSVFGVYNEYIAAPSPGTYWQWFIIAAIAVVAGYVAHRER